MTREGAVNCVAERWERLQIGKPEEFPRVFNRDVQALMENPDWILRGERKEEKNAIPID